MVKIQDSFLTPKIFPFAVINLFPQSSAPGNHWSVFCLYSFAFLEYHINGIRQHGAFWVSIIFMSSHTFCFSVARFYYKWGGTISIDFPSTSWRTCGLFLAITKKILINISTCMPSRFSHVRLFVTLWTVAHQAPLSTGFSRQGYWSGLPCPSPGDLPDPGVKPTFSEPPALHWATRKTHKHQYTGS